MNPADEVRRLGLGFMHPGTRTPPPPPPPTPIPYLYLYHLPLTLAPTPTRTLTPPPTQVAAVYREELHKRATKFDVVRLSWP